MSKEKQIEEMSCKKCLHYEMCLDNFRRAKEEGLWELTDEEEYFAHADECDFYAAGYCKQSEGEWKRKDGFLVCSKCDATKPIAFSTAIKLTYYKCDFCPKCGAKMKGGAGDEK